MFPGSWTVNIQHNLRVIPAIFRTRPTMTILQKTMKVKTPSGWLAMEEKSLMFQLQDELHLKTQANSSLPLGYFLYADRRISYGYCWGKICNYFANNQHELFQGCCVEDTSLSFCNTKPGSSYILIIRKYSRDVTKFDLRVTGLPMAVAKKRYSRMHGHAHTHTLLFFS